MRRGLVLAALLLLAFPLPQSAAAGPAAWWGPTEIGSGFHLRVPVTVTNQFPFPVTGAPVAAEIDLAEKLTAAGWPHTPSGSDDFLSSFHLDQDSVRVVAMTSQGNLRAPDPVPSTYIQGALSARSSFHASFDPFITVLWRIPEKMDPEAQRHFMVYVDTDLTSPKKAPAAYEGLAAGDVDSLFWSGPGLTLYGYARSIANRAAPVQVTALHDGTHVQVFSGSPGPGSILSPAGSFELDAFETRIVGLPAAATVAGVPAGAVAVKVAANLPVVAQATSTGFVPAVDGGMTGKDFVFALRHPREWEQDTLYFTRTGTYPATVLVQRLVEGNPVESWTFQTDKVGPEPYTIGARASIDPSDCQPAPDAPSPLLRGGEGLYRATVQSGDRVLLQLQPTDGVSQVPTAEGATAGTRFWAATGWTDNQGSCTLAKRAGDWFASALGPGAGVNVTNPQIDIQVYPRGSATPDGRYPPPEQVPGGVQVSKALPADMQDRPLLFRSTAPVRLFTGMDPQQVGVDTRPYPNAQPVNQGSPIPALNGPLGGSDAGRGFTGMGAALVFAPFPDTVLDLRVRMVTGEVHTPGVAVAAGGSYLIKDNSPSDPVRSFSFDSNRPVFTYPLGAPAGFLAGVPAFLQATVGAAEFRGFLLDLSAKNGQDPLSGSTVPGQSITYPLLVRNMARDHRGQPLEDFVSVTLDRAELPGWQAEIVGVGEGSATRLLPGQEKAFDLVVTPPEGARDRSQGKVVVTATSLRSFGQSVHDTLQVSTFVRSSAGVGLWFDFENNPLPEKVLEVRADGTAAFALIVKNQGSKQDTIELEAVSNERNWIPHILHAGAEVDAIALPANTSAPLTLVVEAPDGVNGTAYVTVTARSQAVKSMFDTLTATARRIPPSNLVLLVPETFLFVDPGENATFNVTVRNQGEGGTSVNLDVRGGGSSGWGTPRITQRDGTPLVSATLNLAGTANPEKPSEIPLHVTIQAPANATAGISTTVRFGARAPTVAGREEILFVKVRAVHRLASILPGLPLAMAQLGDNLTVEGRLTNLGNLEEDFLVGEADLPAGWALGHPDHLLIPLGATQPLTLDIKAPPGTPSGLYNVTLRLTAADGNVTDLNLPVQVGPVARQSIKAPDGLPVQPGQRASIEVPVANEGNTPLRVVVEPGDNGGWRLAAVPELTLPPGARTSLTLTWEVPAGAPDGAVTRQATLRFLADGGLEPQVQTVASRFDVARADLVVSSAQASDGPAGTLVRASVHNQGLRPARGFDVDLVVDGRTVDRVRVGELPPNGTLEMSLLQSSPGLARVVADGNDTVVESSEANNARALAAGDDKPAPAASVGVLLAVAIALARRRRAGVPER
ncbi:MAG TPA: CARDB domain-containing protein [Candidatus Thermoplasmatota archaeon]|nr:CARDB domain-containing protein [Candidatus Thermoplasmatota archaeon]